MGSKKMLKINIVSKDISYRNRYVRFSICGSIPGATKPRIFQDDY